MALHNAARIADPRSTWGVVEDNPVHSAIRDAAAVCPPDFAMDVLLNTDKKITAVFSGELWGMYRRASNLARDVAMQEVPEEYDLVVTTNSGFPLDQNLYQAVKGISAAAQIVVDGGTIICAAECRKGLPDGGAYADLLASAKTIAEVNGRILASAEVVPDQWQVQVQARVQERATVLVKSSLDDETVRRAHLEPVHDVQSAIDAVISAQRDARVALLPSGPQTIPFIR
jgi:nickel-dependent lactate racemase